MTLFVDSANLEQVCKWVVRYNVAKGCTTNQRIFSQEQGITYETRVRELLNLHVPISIELTGQNCNADELVREALNYQEEFKNDFLVVKVPMWKDGKGLEVTHRLIEEGIKVNMTCLIDINQMILACELGVTYASFFYNRMIDYEQQYCGDKAKPLVWKHIDYSRRLIEQQGFKTKIICGSIRKPDDVYECLVAGAHIVTVTPKVLEQMPFHEASEKVILEFDTAWSDWKCRK